MKRMNLKANITVTHDEQGDIAKVASEIVIIGGEAHIHEHLASFGIMIAEISAQMAENIGTDPEVVMNAARLAIRHRPKPEGES